MVDMATTSFSSISLAAALYAFEEELGQLNWVSVNNEQERLISEYLRPDFTSFSKQELEALASTSATELNNALEVRGSSLRFAPLKDDEIGAYGSLIVNVNWKEKGRKLTIKEMPKIAFAELSDDTAAIRWSNETEAPVAVARTAKKDGDKDGDVVYMAPFSGSLAGLDLIATCRAIKDSMGSVFQADQALVSKQLERSALLYGGDKHLENVRSLRSTLGGVVFPMIDMSQEFALEWVTDLRCLPPNSPPYKVVEAKQANKLKMNHIGAAVRSDTSAVMVLECYTPPTTPLVIEGPFLVWFERPGINEAYFAALVDQDSWKDPKDLTV
jgi:hypothetical protein